MQKLQTHYEQISIEAVKKIVEALSKTKSDGPSLKIEAASGKLGGAKDPAERESTMSALRKPREGSQQREAPQLAQPATSSHQDVEVSMHMVDDCGQKPGDPAALLEELVQRIQVETDSGKMIDLVQQLIVQIDQERVGRTPGRTAEQPYEQAKPRSE